MGKNLFLQTTLERIQYWAEDFLRPEAIWISASTPPTHTLGWKLKNPSTHVEEVWPKNVEYLQIVFSFLNNFLIIFLLRNNLAEMIKYKNNFSCSFLLFSSFS